MPASSASTWAVIPRFPKRISLLPSTAVAAPLVGSAPPAGSAPSNDLTGTAAQLPLAMMPPPLNRLLLLLPSELLAPAPAPEATLPAPAPAPEATLPAPAPAQEAALPAPAPAPALAPGPEFPAEVRAGN